MTIHHHERRNVLNDFGAASGNGKFSDTNELMYRAQTADDRFVLNNDMPR